MSSYDNTSSRMIDRDRTRLGFVCCDFMRQLYTLYLSRYMLLIYTTCVGLTREQKPESVIPRIETGDE